MMNSLADQLKAKGLVSEEKYNQHKKQEQGLNQAAQGRLKNKFKGTKGIVTYDETQLDMAKTVDEFKFTAKGMLTNDPEAITTIVQKAHDFRDRTGNKRIVWFVYKVRDGLKNCPVNRRDELLKRMFRRNNPKFELLE